MSSFRPLIVYEDNVIFSKRFKYITRDKDATVVFDIKYFVTPYGFFLPTTVSEFCVLDYLKNPTENNKAKVTPFLSHVYMLTVDGEITALTISAKTKGKFFSERIPTGLGIKAIYNAGERLGENAATILFGVDSYEEFIKIIDITYDPHKNTVRMKISEIVELLRSMGVTKNIETSELMLTENDDVSL